jgi:hypothetical protein
MGDLEVNVPGGTARYSVIQSPDGGRTIRVGGDDGETKTINLEDYETVWYVQQPREFKPLAIVLVVMGCLAGVIPGLVILYWLYKNRDYRYLIQLRGKPYRKTAIFEAGEENKRDASGLGRMIHEASGLGYYEEIGVD